MAIQKWELFFSGQVQGVGFRYTASQIARRHDISGWVRNLSDGRVEVSVQGDPAELERFLDSLGSETHGRISNIDKSKVPVEPDLTGFVIRR